MSQRSVFEGTPTERYVFNISAWWTKHVLGTDIRNEPQIIGRTANNKVEEDSSGGQRGVLESRSQITIASDVLPGIGAQFKTAQIHCHISAGTRAESQLDVKIEIDMTANDESVKPRERSSTEEAHESDTDKKHEEKITFDTKPVEATIKTS